MKCNFTMSELIKSDFAIKYKINNIPNDTQILDNMFHLITECLQPLRDYIQRPMIINSGYRCGVVNEMIGGVSNSQHLTGCAVDFTVKGMTIKQIVEAVKRSGIDFDQCINEHNLWCHLSYKKNENRKQYLVL